MFNRPSIDNFRMNAFSVRRFNKRNGSVRIEFLTNDVDGAYKYRTKGNVDPSSRGHGEGVQQIV